jgi:hypothetical protein
LEPLAGGYLWAVVFGHALPGLKSTPALNRSSGPLPDANVAFLVAWLGFFTSPLPLVWCAAAQPRVGGRPLGYLRTLVISAAVGAALFGIALAIGA